MVTPAPKMSPCRPPAATAAPRRQRSWLLRFSALPVHPLRRGHTRELLDLRERVHHRQPRPLLPGGECGVGTLKLSREHRPFPTFRRLLLPPLAERVLLLPGCQGCPGGFATLGHGDLGV